LAKGGPDSNAKAYDQSKEILRDLSRSRAVQGFTSTETASFVFSLKQPLFHALNRAADGKRSDKVDAAQATWEITLLLDRLGLRAPNPS
jgi:rsbT co-antagonist protein RsbR